MIILKLQGGLGNQMFQAAAGYALAKHHNTKLKLDLSFLLKNNKSTETFTARSYELNNFNHNFEIATEKDIDLFFPRNKKLSTRFIRKIKRLILKPKTINDNYSADIFFKKTSKYTYLNGYWQKENFFGHYRGKILSLFEFPDLNEQNKAIKKKIAETNSVAVHFRRGDYAKKEHVKKVHGICDFTYYTAAINHISKQTNNFTLFLFSDDPDWVIQNFKTNHDFEVVNTGQAHTDMHLMSLCKHNIIANSSFSWWGAWLNQNPDKIIIAPRKWFAIQKKNKQSKHIIPESWVKL